MGASFLDWLTRPRQILVIFAVTLAVAAISASNKIHQCHASKASRGDQKFLMRNHRVVDMIETRGLELDEEAAKQRAAALSNHAALTGKEATLVNKISALV